MNHQFGFYPKKSRNNSEKLTGHNAFNPKFIFQAMYSHEIYTDNGFRKSRKLIIITSKPMAVVQDKY